jgi:two-component system sensor histidine kinase ChiS
MAIKSLYSSWQKNIKKSIQKIPIRAVLVIPFVLQTVTAVGLTGYLSYKNGQRAVEELATYLQASILERVTEYLDNYLVKPKEINQVNLDGINLKYIDLNNLSNLGQYFWKQMQVFPVGYINYANQAGEFIGIERLDNGELRFNIINKKTGIGNLQIYETNSQGEPNKLLEVTPNYDPRKEAWYAEAIALGKPLWTQIYQWEDKPDILSISSSYPVKVDNQVVGVIGVDLILSQIGEFLKNLTVSEHGQIFIIERNGLLVASSNSEKPYHIVNGKSQRLKAIESHDPLVSNSTNFLISHFGNLKDIQNKSFFTFPKAGNHYFLGVSSFIDPAGIDWLIVVVIPETDFMEKIHANNLITTILCLLALVVAIILGILTARWITSPILRLNYLAKNLSAGDLEKRLITDRQDEIGELAKSFNDMATQLQVSFRDLANKNSELERLNQLKDEFLANTSHELKTPLNGIIGITESMLDGATGEISEVQRRNLFLVAQSGRRLFNLINDILDFSKLRHKNIFLQLDAIDLKQITEIVIIFSQVLVKSKPIAMINNISADLPPVYADFNRLQQILYNLIGNAIKFTDQGQVVMTAEVINKTTQIVSPNTNNQNTDSHNTELINEQIANQDLPIDQEQVMLITISDTGIGIETEQLDKIFESFEQGDGSNAREYGGTGLGLAISKKLVELHGGKIWAESQLGVGTQLIFTLPIATIAPAKLDGENNYLLAQAQSLEENTIIQLETDLIIPAERASQTKFNIFIVDDELVNLQVLTNHLTLHNYIVHQANSGPEALEMLKNGYHPDLILLDVMMPKMTGYEVTRQIREIWSADEMPILLLSAKNQVIDLVTGLESGANDYITKPFAKDELIARIKTHLHIKDLEAETLRLALESENRLRQFLEAMPVGVFITDGRGKPHYLNKIAEELLGETLLPYQEEQLLTAMYHAYLTGTNEIYPEEKTPIFKALQGETTRQDDMEIHRGDLVIPIEVRGTPIYDDHGNIAYAIAVFQDIRERKQAEQEKQQFLEQLSQANLNLEKALDSELTLTDAYGRFVPHQLLYFLGHESITEVGLGEAVQKEMSVLFSDIRNFTDMSEKMTPQDNFKFINAFLSRMEPAIIEHDGFIDKYMGDGIMALFDGAADNAVKSAIAMLATLHDYNVTRGRPDRPKIHIGIGINTGDLILGTVGGQNRMDGTVISDAVNLASRIESLTKDYGVALLISQNTFMKLEYPENYYIRLIDQVKVRGKSKLVTVYEVFDSDPDELRLGKIATKSDFEQGLLSYYQGDYQRAIALLQVAQEINPLDQVINIYLKRCHENLALLS